MIKYNNNTVNKFAMDSTVYKIYVGGNLAYIGVQGESPTPPTPSYPYAFERISRGGSAYTIQCDSTSAQTVTSAQTRSGLTAAQLSSTTATETPVSVTFGDCCNVINSGACSGWTQLTSVTISDSVTNINKQAFRGCKSLMSIIIPDSVTSLENGVFSGCTNLSSVTLSDSIILKSRVFEKCSSLTSIDLPISGNNKVDDYLCSECYSLTSVTIPDSVTSIGNGAFNDCSGLTSIDIPDGVTSIGTYAFYGCSSLTSVSIPSGVTSIGTYGFHGCSSLASVTIPSGVTSIGNAVFRYCTGLTSITVEATTPPTLGSNVFNNTNDCPIYVPCESVEAYKTAWSTYADRITCVHPSRLPSGYTEVEYVENTSSAYINTEVLLYDSTTNSYEIETKMSSTWGGGEFEYLLATEGTSNPYTGLELRWNTHYQSGGELQCERVPNNAIYSNVDNGDGTSAITISCSSTTATNGNIPLTLFCGLYSNSPWRNGKGKIYDLKITKNDALVRDLVPCKRDSDEMVGMYDIVNDVFYYPPNYQSYQLIAGPIV